MPTTAEFRVISGCSGLICAGCSEGRLQILADRGVPLPERLTAAKFILGAHRLHLIPACTCPHASQAYPGPFTLQCCDAASSHASGESGCSVVFFPVPGLSVRNAARSGVQKVHEVVGRRSACSMTQWELEHTERAEELQKCQWDQAKQLS